MTMLEQVADQVLRSNAMQPSENAFHRVAIIDIGSNSIRLVVYDGPRRIPFTLFNEKVMAGLGADVGTTGRIGAAAVERGIRALARFKRLCRDMGVDDIRCVATAAVRDASNGPQFIRRAAEIGLAVRVLSGVEEGRASAAGLLSGMPAADGVMGDLGGGSLELVRVKAGEILQAVSVPLGVLRVQEIRARGKEALSKEMTSMLADAGWGAVPRNLPFYLVGGSWRALARVDMHIVDYPLPIFHHYEMAPARVPHLQRYLANVDKTTLKGIPAISGSRIPTLQDAAALLQALCVRLGSDRLMVSAYGLREGLLFQDLSPVIAGEDPLLVAARTEGEAQARFHGNGDLIDAWIAPLFGDDAPPLRRIRHAACLLADVGWRANPDFRAERGMETGLHGNWVGITGAERAMLAQALYTSLGGGETPTDDLRRLAGSEALARAVQWGLAIRLAQRLSGGVATALTRLSVHIADGTLILSAPHPDADIFGESSDRRLRQLALAMGLDHRTMAPG